MVVLDISVFSLLKLGVLLLVPVVLDWFYQLGLVTNLLSSVARMVVQLLLIGLFLKYIFIWDNPFLNIFWFCVMVVASVFAVIKNTSFKIKTIFFPLLLAFSLPSFLVVLYLTGMILNLPNVFAARYFLIMGGMLLGNCLRGNIIALSNVYGQIRENQKNYFYLLSLGASVHEALLPYLQRAVRIALKPFLATVATMGLVALPGMMTGVILGGASPGIAVKYQIMIMLAILSVGFTGIILGVVFSAKVCFDSFGCLKLTVFKK